MGTQSVATLSPQQLREKLCVTSRKSSATLPLTLSKKWPQQQPPHHWRRATSCLMVRSSPLAMSVSGAQRPSSSHPSWEWSHVESMRPPTTTSGRTSMPILSCLEAPPCTLVLLTVCRRKSLPLHHLLRRSRSLPHQKGNTQYGLEDPSWLHSQPSSRCGSANKNMTSLAHPLCTGSASKPSSSPPFSATSVHSNSTKFVILRNCKQMDFISL